MADGSVELMQIVGWTLIVTSAIVGFVSGWRSSSTASADAGILPLLRLIVIIGIIGAASFAAVSYVDWWIQDRAREREIVRQTRSAQVQVQAGDDRTIYEAKYPAGSRWGSARFVRYHFRFEPVPAAAFGAAVTAVSGGAVVAGRLTGRRRLRGRGFPVHVVTPSANDASGR